MYKLDNPKYFTDQEKKDKHDAKGQGLYQLNIFDAYFRLGYVKLRSGLSNKVRKGVRIGPGRVRAPPPPPNTAGS